VVPTVIASKGSAARNAVMFTLNVGTFFGIANRNAISPAGLEDMVQASIIRGEFSVEIGDGVPLNLCFSIIA
jgi:hypothetical protein